MKDCQSYLISGVFSALLIRQWNGACVFVRVLKRKCETYFLHSDSKQGRQYYWAYLQILTDFKNSFTVALSRNFTIKRPTEITPHFRRVATLPCEMQTLKIRTDCSHGNAKSCEHALKSNVAAVDELVLKQEDQSQIRHSTHSIAQVAVVKIIFFTQNLGLKRRLLKVWLKHVTQDSVAQNSRWMMLSRDRSIWTICVSHCSHGILWYMFYISCRSTCKCSNVICETVIVVRRIVRNVIMNANVHFIGTSGVTYIRWGRKTCEGNSATLLYSGKSLRNEK